MSAPKRRVQPAEKPKPLIFGHRGAAGLVAENTLPSFARAVALGVDGIELDVHYSQQQVWVIHDSTLKRTTGVSGGLDDYTPAELRSFLAGPDARIPTLAEALTAVPDHVQINIELKGPNTALPVFELTRHENQRRLLISSFDHQELHHYRALGGTARLGVLLDRWRPAALQTARELKAWSLHLALRIVTQHRVASIRNQGFKVLVYTVNQTRTGRRLVKMGVDGLFTDRPDKLSHDALAG